jgi:hypothetical protein
MLIKCIFPRPEAQTQTHFPRKLRPRRPGTVRGVISDLSSCMWFRSWMRRGLHQEHDESQEADAHAGRGILRELVLLDERLKRLIIHP